MEKITRDAVEFAGVRGRGFHVDDEGQVLCRQIDKFNLYVDMNDESVTPCLIRDGYWESWITAWCFNNIGPDDNCVDIGANMGYFTGIFAEISLGGNVIAFEPQPVYYNLLKKSIALNQWQNVTVYPYAISDKEGTATLVIPGKLGGSASIAVEKFDPKWGVQTDLTVKTICLDAWSDQRIDFIKIDAEGAEPSIWAGMQGVLANNPQCVIIMEWDARRWPTPITEFFLQKMGERFAITAIELDGSEKQMSAHEILNSSDWEMLVLRPQ